MALTTFIGIRFGDIERKLPPKQLGGKFALVCPWPPALNLTPFPRILASLVTSSPAFPSSHFPNLCSSHTSLHRAQPLGRIFSMYRSHSLGSTPLVECGVANNKGRGLNDGFDYSKEETRREDRALSVFFSPLTAELR